MLEEELRVKTRERGYGEGQASGSLVYNWVRGGEHWSDLAGLRGAAGPQELWGVGAVLAPTTAGEFLRKFAIGAVPDWHRGHLRVHQRVRPQQSSPTCTLDLDSSISEPASTHKEGSAKASNGEIGSHPWFAFWAAEGELLFSHLRRGRAHTARNILWFLRATLKRVPLGIPTNLRADSGFYSRAVVEWCALQGFTFPMTADQTAPLLETIGTVSEWSWRSLPDYALSEVAEVRYQPPGWNNLTAMLSNASWRRRRTASGTGSILWWSPMMRRTPPRP